MDKVRESLSWKVYALQWRALQPRSWHWMEAQRAQVPRESCSSADFSCFKPRPKLNRLQVYAVKPRVPMKNLTTQLWALLDASSSSCWLSSLHRKARGVPGSGENESEKAHSAVIGGKGSHPGWRSIVLWYFPVLRIISALCRLFSTKCTTKSQE